MRKISFDVLGLEARSTFSGHRDQEIGDIADIIQWQMRLAPSDSYGSCIAYTLFKDNDGNREPLQRKRTLQQSRVQEGEQLYIANPCAPWWLDDISSSTATTLASMTPDVTCRLALAARCEVLVAETRVQLGRNYLIRHLPRRIVLLEQARHVAGVGSRLRRVSRERHCELYCEGDTWRLRTFHTTSVNRRMITSGETTMLPGSSYTIVLGHAGWPIEMQLSPV